MEAFLLPVLSEPLRVSWALLSANLNCLLNSMRVAALADDTSRSISWWDLSSVAAICASGDVAPFSAEIWLNLFWERATICCWFTTTWFQSDKSLIVVWLSGESCSKVLRMSRSSRSLFLRAVYGSVPRNLPMTFPAPTNNAPCEKAFADSSASALFIMFIATVRGTISTPARPHS